MFFCNQILIMLNMVLTAPTYSILFCPQPNFSKGDLSLTLSFSDLNSLHCTNLYRPPILSNKFTCGCTIEWQIYKNSSCASNCIDSKMWLLLHSSGNNKWSTHMFELHLQSLAQMHWNLGNFVNAPQYYYFDAQISRYQYISIKGTHNNDTS